MVELKSSELYIVNGGDNLGNGFLLVGTIIASIGTGGVPGILIGAGIRIAGYLSTFE
ncbi:hypothetical protein ABGF49_08350 [Helcococcus ovis]|uniref:hypothetical protein n=1 Tax=Helcococcus TaxID=31983 RepID=UPI001430C216|nr:hypothetical protein [Helcococcus ovis]